MRYAPDYLFARNGAEVTLKLFNVLSDGEIKENIIFSPFSVRTCMGLAFAGTGEGLTADEIINCFQFTTDSKKDAAKHFQVVLDKYKNSAVLKIANKVYVMEGRQIKADYKATLEQHYYAEAESVNFGQNVAAAQRINAWVEQKTAGKIKELIGADALGHDTRLVLLNALHFKGDWVRKFDEARTAEDTFWLDEAASTKVQFMSQKAKFGYGHFAELECTALEMPYKDTDLSMFVLLPESRSGLKVLAKKLQTDRINLCDLGKKLHEEEVAVKFPKFKADYSVELCEAMKQMGVKTMFSGGADFSNMLELPENIFVSNIFHKACIEVNEEGTEAAAATGMVMMMRCMPMSLQFEADHPFLYFIWNKKNVLFAGAFVKSPVG